MSKVVHLSDHAHNKAKAYCQARGLKMSEWVASLIDRAAEGQSATDVLPTPQINSQALGDLAPGATGRDTGAVSAHHAEGEGVSNYQALVQKKKLAQPVAPVQNLAEQSTPVYEAPPFWAR